jgi:Uma2 family endonuclease
VAIEPASQVTVTPHRWTIDEYYRMAETGILKPDARVELIEGVVVDMPPIGPDHAGSVDLVGDLFRLRLGSGVIVRGQHPLRLRPGVEPQPDICVVRRRADWYRSGHPTPADVLLVVEVSDSSLEYDRETKALLYAQAGIVDYLILNLVDKQIEVYRDPSPEGYKSVEIKRHGDTIQLVAFSDVAIAVTDILG